MVVHVLMMMAVPLLAHSTLLIDNFKSGYREIDLLFSFL